MPTLLITRGDDLGSFPEANRALIDCHRTGILKNISIMAPCPAFSQGAELALTCPDLCLGLHLTISSEWESVRWGPVSDPADVPSLVDADGNFHAEPGVLMRQGFALDEILLEARAQLRKARAHGLPIRYLDEHMYFGWIHQPGGPRVHDALARLAVEEGLLWHRHVIDEELRHFNARIGDQPTQDDVIGVVRMLEPGRWLWITHPTQHGGYMDHSRLRYLAQQEAGAEGRTRATEIQLLTSKAISEACLAAQVRPVTYLEAEAARVTAADLAAG